MKSHVPYNPGASSPPPAGGPITPSRMPFSQNAFQYVSMSCAACRYSGESDAAWTSIMLSTGPICGLCGAASRTARYIFPWAIRTWRAAPPPLPAPLLRLDGAPLDREAVGVVAQLLRQREVLLEPAVVVAGQAGDGTVLDIAALVLPGPPLVVAIVPFHLVRRGRAAPVEAVRKLERHPLSPLPLPLCPPLFDHHPDDG